MTPAAPTAEPTDSPRTPLWLRAETTIVGVALAVLTNALIGPLFAPQQGSVAEGEALRIMWLPVYAVALAVCALHAARLKRVWPAAIGLALLLAWPFASKLWSLDPETTQRRCIALGFTTLFGLMLAARYSWRDLVRLLAAVFGVLAAGSLFAGIVFPDWAINHSTNPNDWKGLWYEKNALGANMALGAISALCAATIDRRRRRLWLVVIALCLIMLVMARSATSLMVVIAGFSLVGGLALVRRGPVAAVVTAWLGLQAVGLLAAVALMAPEALLKALGKDPTLTGRTDIWAALLRRVAESPWLGYGYQAFWSPDRHGPAAIIRKETHWTVPSAHNGWLELLIQLGWVGVILFALNYLLTAGAAALGAPARRDGGFALAFVAVFGIFSLSESYIFQHNSISWVLYVAVTAKLFELAPAARRARSAATAGQALPPTAGPASPVPLASGA